jgi:surface carbohydrate biosynthesis protein (TIGR04326 family)
LGSQARGLYLFENQIWERNLITAWSESGANGPLIGYQHSFPKFMDSRLFEDPCAYALTGDPPPLPDVLATCGPAAFEVMEQSGFPASRLRTVEAVRYDYLRHHGPTDRSSLRTEERTLLVLGSIGHHESRDLLALLAGAAAAGALSTFPRIMAKSHPNMPLRPIIQDVCADIQITETQEPLSRLWAEVDMVVCANSTTACIEALWIGKPVVALGGRRSLNLNPLFRVGRMPFVNSVEELVSALQRPVANTPSAALFHFSPGLTEWRKLLAETGTRDVLQPQALYRSAQVLSRRSRTP